MRRFARVELGEDTVPDESTILRFRHAAPDLLHGRETTLYGDKAYYQADDKARTTGPVRGHSGRNWECGGEKYLVNKSGKRSAKWDKINAAR